MLIKISDAAAKFEVSNRTLRYWEENGILSSVRMENGFCYYDEENIQKIKQIVLLRKLRMHIHEIHRFFVAKDTALLLESLKRHLARVEAASAGLSALSVVVNHLIRQLELDKSFDEIMDWLEQTGGIDEAALKYALRFTLSEKEYPFNHTSFGTIGDIRILNLPKMNFIAYKAESAAPEADCDRMMERVIEILRLREYPGFRRFGFSGPEAAEGKPVYGYEMWATVPEQIQVPPPYWKVPFDGGLFASIPARLSNIGDRWMLLRQWVQNSDHYEADWRPKVHRRYLEEELNAAAKNPRYDQQIDLLAPIKRKKSI